MNVVQRGISLLVQPPARKPQVARGPEDHETSADDGGDGQHRRLRFLQADSDEPGLHEHERLERDNARDEQ